MPSKNWINTLSVSLLVATGISQTLAVSASASQVQHRLIHVEGKVELVDRTPPLRIYGRTVLNFDHRIRLEAGARATIQCYGRNIVHWRQEGLSGLRQICPHPPQNQNRRTRVTTRKQDPNIPYIISPRGTGLLTDRPTLRWNPVAGAVTYQIKLLADIGIWTTTASASDCEDTVCEINYPSEFPPLVADTEYAIIIRTDQGRESQTEPGRGFWYLNDDNRETITMAQTEIEAGIEAEELPPVDRGLAIAVLYQSMELFSAAIEELEAIPEAKTVPEGTVLLGELYQEIGLGTQAERYYRLAIEYLTLEQEIEQRLVLARSQAALGSYLLGLEGEAQTEAVEWLNAAIALYEELGDSTTAESLQALLDGASVQQ